MPTQLLQQKRKGGGGREENPLAPRRRDPMETAPAGPAEVAGEGAAARRHLSGIPTDRPTEGPTDACRWRGRRAGRPSGHDRSQLEAASVSEAEEAGEALQGEEQDFSDESSAFSSQPVGVAGEMGSSPSFSRFFCFIRRFWNQIFTCVSLSWREAAISTRLALVRYLLK